MFYSAQAHTLLLYRCLPTQPSPCSRENRASRLAYRPPSFFALIAMTIFCPPRSTHYSSLISAQFLTQDLLEFLPGYKPPSGVSRCFSCRPKRKRKSLPSGGISMTVSQRSTIKLGRGCRCVFAGRGPRSTLKGLAEEKNWHSKIGTIAIRHVNCSADRPRCFHTRLLC